MNKKKKISAYAVTSQSFGKSTLHLQQMYHTNFLLRKYIILDMKYLWWFNEITYFLENDPTCRWYENANIWYAEWILGYSQPSIRLKIDGKNPLYNFGRLTKSFSGRMAIYEINWLDTDNHVTDVAYSNSAILIRWFVNANLICYVTPVNGTCI